MTDSILAEVRKGNLTELDNYYKKNLDEYTSLYQQYLNSASGNDDDKISAEEDLKPKIVDKNNMLIKLSELFLENNQESLRLIETDYEMIDSKTLELKKLEIKLQEMDTVSFDGNEADKIKGNKKLENIATYTKKNTIILTVLTIINLLLLALLILGIARLIILNKKTNLTNNLSTNETNNLSTNKTNNQTE
jgi:hypothetical protein